jgi:hypothetical protein
MRRAVARDDAQRDLRVLGNVDVCCLVVSLIWYDEVGVAFLSDPANRSQSERP